MSKRERERRRGGHGLSSGSLDDIDAAGSDADGDGVEISHLEPADGVATHPQDAVLPLQNWYHTPTHQPPSTPHSFTVEFYISYQTPFTTIRTYIVEGLHYCAFNYLTSRGR